MNKNKLTMHGQQHVDKTSRNIIRELNKRNEKTGTNKVPYQSRGWFLAQLSDNSDFTDCRYRVRRVIFSQYENSQKHDYMQEVEPFYQASLEFVQYFKPGESDNLRQDLIATNIAEIETNSHLIDDDRIVIVFEILDPSTNMMRYYFSAEIKIKQRYVKITGHTGTDYPYVYTFEELLHPTTGQNPKTGQLHNLFEHRLPAGVTDTDGDGFIPNDTPVVATWNPAVGRWECDIVPAFSDCD
jgi:hypothetical protein